MAKVRVQPNGQERLMREDDFIVSKTDPKGIITYGNRTFVEFSGYSESELLGRPHNIIRHPGMPKAVFRLMWESLKTGREFFGYIKNLSMDGSHYWTFSNITTSLDDQGKLLGYFSVRRQPRREAISVLEPIYHSLLETERRTTGKAGIEEALEQLQQILKERGGSYDDFVLSL